MPIEKKPQKASIKNTYSRGKDKRLSTDKTSSQKIAETLFSQENSDPSPPETKSIFSNQQVSDSKSILEGFLDAITKEHGELSAPGALAKAGKDRLKLLGNIDNATKVLQHVIAGNDDEAIVQLSRIIGEYAGDKIGGEIGGKLGAAGGSLIGPEGTVAGGIAGGTYGAMYGSQKMGDIAERIAREQLNYVVSNDDVPPTIEKKDGGKYFLAKHGQNYQWYDATPQEATQSRSVGSLASNNEKKYKPVKDEKLTDELTQEYAEKTGYINRRIKEQDKKNQEDRKKNIKMGLAPDGKEFNKQYTTDGKGVHASQIWVEDKKKKQLIGVNTVDTQGKSISSADYYDKETGRHLGTETAITEGGKTTKSSTLPSDKNSPPSPKPHKTSAKPKNTPNSADNKKEKSNSAPNIQKRTPQKNTALGLNEQHAPAQKGIANSISPETNSATEPNAIEKDPNPNVAAATEEQVVKTHAPGQLSTVADEMPDKTKTPAQDTTLSPHGQTDKTQIPAPSTGGNSDSQLAALIAQLSSALAQLTQPIRVVVDVQHGNIVAAVNAANSQQQRRS
ncbi:hypothetical protein [Chromobacterium subtsugae]|uniref:hypothetical protein n=1 Tax=Chromobacterium subtsugae TaxID=251747 RepID=UPI000A9BDAB1|nr:hypothetical protein [Chromobacterium subtsugae]